MSQDPYLDLNLSDELIDKIKAYQAKDSRISDRKYLKIADAYKLVLGTQIKNGGNLTELIKP